LQQLGLAHIRGDHQNAYGKQPGDRELTSYHVNPSYCFVPFPGTFLDLGTVQSILAP
jgi:hypothetical protein